MRRFINDPHDLVNEMLEGFIDVHGARVAMVSPRVVARRDLDQAKVGLVTGGGSGHKPAFIGYVGRGLLDAVVVGDIFTSPPAKAVLAAIRAVDRGVGVLLLLGNYAGDVMNFRIAQDMARAEGHLVELAVMTDDIGAGDAVTEDGRRGVVGQLMVWKACGAAAAQGASLEDLVRLARSVNAATRTIGVAAGPLILPALGRPSFDLADGQVEYGVGHHGERGRLVIPLQSVDALVDRMVDDLDRDLGLRRDDRLGTIVNGLGGTPLMELYVVHRRLRLLLGARDVSIHRAFVANYFTAMEMPGFSITLTRLDDQLARLIDADSDAVLFRQSAP